MDIFNSILLNDTEKLKKIITENPTLIETKEDGCDYTPLMTASLCGKNKIVKVLLEHGANINAKDKHGDTAFELAIEMGYLKTAKTLLEHGADINAKNERGISILMNECFYHTNKKSVRFLLENNADTEAKDTLERTALIQAASFGKNKTVKILLEYGANIEAKDKFGNTPLLAAVSSNNIKAIKTLLNHGADINAMDVYGNTPLICASEDGNTEIAKLLEESKNNKEIQKHKNIRNMLVAGILLDRCNVKS